MAITDFVHPRNPLNAKLDAKSFVQLTVWVMVILGAWMLGKYLLAMLQSKAKQLTGKETATGSSNPFFG